MTIKERNNGGGFVRSKNRVVEEFASHIADMNHKGFSDGKFKLL